MCYKFKEPEDTITIKMAFDAEFPELGELLSGREHFGFTHPQCPIIMDDAPNTVVYAKWGLIPAWAAAQDPKEFYKKANTLNAKIEEVHQKASYKKSIDSRCLILAQEFVEYKHVDVGRKTPEKVPYRIFTKDRMPFAIAGLYNIINGEPTFTLLTTEANELMAEIHNSAKRMPVVLTRDEQKLWLQRDRLEPYHNRTEIELDAIPYHDAGAGLFS